MKRKSNFRRNILIGIILIVGIWYLKNYSENELINTKEVNSNFSQMIVSKNYELDEEYKPNKLQKPNISFADESTKEEKLVDKVIKEPLEQLVKEAKSDGIILLGNSGYRSYNTQKKLYDMRVLSDGKEMADKYVAKAGFSEHQTGLSIDITNEERYFVKGTKEAEWLANNCYKYGFIIRYPEGKEYITGVAYEPWHIRYVGEEAAKYINDNNLTLEEYLGK
ncbi:M15 family metallopeptidase [Clostridium sp. 1001271B_151109_B4]|uniref:M15 family metallopeptidase n=1 Tax=Clostridium sp. 1001271B_151109_B4 TaxID=2787148 RepID=UPI0018A91F70|nr:M15 family metallopeptidase [Clostridium sp. 1001271B_151109_B4]